MTELRWTSHGPTLEEAAVDVLTAWGAADQQELWDISEELWDAISRLEQALDQHRKQ
jgi:hypothetical protein